NGGLKPTDSSTPTFTMLPTVSDGIFYTIPAIFHHSRQHRNLEIRHSRAGGNPDPRLGGNLSEMTETPRF
ncbi:hypothetical protein, partial [Neisseria gonorrhoeae]|uniref:hypothetical protein n=1 Tax=Neisseria gonorrhoeae TaxID=485 RepID=UPI00311F42DE